MSSASAPRTSPTTMRSGRIRSDARARARAPTPRPRLRRSAGRASSRTTCGCSRRSSAVSSIVTIALAGRDRGRQRVQQRRLAGARAAGHDDVPTRGDRPAQEAAARGARRERLERDGPRREAADRHARPVDRERRDHRVQARPVGEPRVDHRRGTVETQTERRDDTLDEAHDAGRVEVERRPARRGRRAPRRHGPDR